MSTISWLILKTISKRMNCKACSLKFAKISTYQVHLSLKHSEDTNLKQSRPSLMIVSLCRLGEESFKCYKCNTGFVIKSQWIKHIRSAHQESSSNIDSPSENIDQSPSQRSESIHGDTSKICVICEQVFGTKQHLKRHIASVHEGKRPYRYVFVPFGTLPLF